MKKLVPFKYKRAIKEHLGVPSLHWSLTNLRKKGWCPGVVIDVGAYEGYWTRDLLEVFPEAKVLMVEAQKNKEDLLRTLVGKQPNTAYVIQLLSSISGGEKYFFESETASHVVTGNSRKSTAQKLTTITLDDLLLQLNFPPPDFLKLDVQGHEKEVLLGAINSLRQATVCLLEISLLNIGGNTPLLAEMIQFMDSKGYQAYDISHFIRRPYDKALYQVDMFFVKKDSYLATEERW